MYNKKSALEFRIENDAYLVAKDRHRQIYMAKSGGEFLVFYSKNQSTEIIDTADKDAVGRMRDELLKMANNPALYPFDIEVNGEYLRMFKESQLKDDLNEEENNLYEMLINDCEDRSENKEVFIDLDGVDKLQSLISNEDWPESISVRAGSINTENELTLFTMTYDRQQVIEISDMIADFGLFTSLIVCESKQNDINAFDNFNLSSFASLDTLLNYEKGLSQLEISKEGLQGLDSGSWQSVHFLASSDNWKEDLSEYQRTFQTSSEEKVFDSSMGGYSMLSMPTDVITWFGSSRQFPIRMEDAKIDKFYFTGDDIKGLNFAEVINHIKNHDNKVQIKSSIKL